MDTVLLEKATDDFIKAVNPAWRKYHRIADKSAPRVRNQILKAIAALQGSVALKDVQRALERKDIKAAVKSIDWTAFETNLKAIGVTEIGQLFKRSSVLAIKDLKALPKVEITTSFTLRNKEAERFIERNATKIARDISKESQKAIRAIIRDGFKEGNPPAKMARQIRPLIGVNDRQAKALVKLRRDLNIQRAAGKSPFKTVRLTQQKVNDLVKKQTERFIRQRAIMISRTETIRSASMGIQNSWEEAIRQGFLDPKFTRKVWIVTPDDRLCDYCSSMDGQTIEIQADFQSGEVELQNGDIRSFPETISPPLHPMCRCATVLEFIN